MTSPPDVAAEVPHVVALDGTCTLSREDIGGKAWGVNRMRALGLPVPPAFVVTTAVCREYFRSGTAVFDRIWPRLQAHMVRLEEGTKRHFGGDARPLLVSVRSGAAHSMPGMMDTILDLGLNARIEAALAGESGDPRFADDTRHRFEDQYRRVVLGGGNEPVPEDPWAQLQAALAAVFDSWHSPRARAYRRNRGLPDDGGTAVTIQAMVFGNLDARSGAGVLFSRNPLTGDGPPWGEWLARSQGEEVVSGSRTPSTLEALRAEQPAVHEALLRAAVTLERDARDIQDIEFTVESGTLWLLQCRIAKRSPQAALRAAVALADAGLITPDEALARLDGEQLRHLSTLELAPAASATPPIVTGEPACPGVACGFVVDDPEQAEARARWGDDVILVRPTTSPDDLPGVIAARGLVTELGGATSHAAVVSRELGRPCIVGCGEGCVATLLGRHVTMDGATGRIWQGDLTIDRTREDRNSDAGRLVEWGLARLPLRVVPWSAAPPGTIDLDPLGEAWRTGLRRGRSVRGRILDTEDGVHAALLAGVVCIAVRHPLPAVLSGLHASRLVATVVPTVAVPAPAHEAAPLTLLRLAALKGRADADTLADALGLPREAVVESYRPLCDLGWCVWISGTLRLAPAGRERLGQLLLDERRNVDTALAAETYRAFEPLNQTLKRAMTDWQVKPDGTANDHADPSYDARVIEHLAALHRRVVPFLKKLPGVAPRLGLYLDRLERAAARIAAGDRSFVARIIADSYHTVWYELHEDLLSVAGLSRQQQGTGAA